MDKKELQKAQNIIDSLFYDDKYITQWQHRLLEDVILLAQDHLSQPDIKGRKKLLCTHENYRAGHSPYVACICNDCGKEI